MVIPVLALNKGGTKMTTVLALAPNIITGYLGSDKFLPGHCSRFVDDALSSKDLFLQADKVLGISVQNWLPHKAELTRMSGGSVLLYDDRVDNKKYLQGLLKPQAGIGLFRDFMPADFFIVNFSGKLVGLSQPSGILSYMHISSGLMLIQYRSGYVGKVPKAIHIVALNDKPVKSRN